MIPTTTARVPQNTSAQTNRRIDNTTRQSVARYAAQGRKAIDRRIAQLDREWDIERMLEANAATAVLIGCGLGAFVNRKLFALPALVGGFLLQHAVQGWCPPVPLLRRLGFRTEREIDEERFALKAIRGDFNQVLDGGPDGRIDTQQALAAARR